MVWCGGCGGCGVGGGTCKRVEVQSFHRRRKIFDRVVSEMQFFECLQVSQIVW